MLGPFEELDGALVFLSGRTCPEGPQIFALAGLGVFLSRIEPIA